MIGFRMRQLLALIFIVVLGGAGIYLLTPEGRQLIDRVRINMTRADYIARFRAGETLPGTPDLEHIDAAAGGRGRGNGRAGLCPHLQART